MRAGPGLCAVGRPTSTGRASSAWRRTLPSSPRGAALFAVAEDGRTLVTRPLAGSASWLPVALTPAPRSIGGLAADEEALYLADTAGASVGRVVLAAGGPSGRPSRCCTRGRRCGVPASSRSRGSSSWPTTRRATSTAFRRAAEPSRGSSASPSSLPSPSTCRGASSRPRATSSFRCGADTGGGRGPARRYRGHHP